MWLEGHLGKVRTSGYPILPLEPWCWFHWCVHLGKNPWVAHSRYVPLHIYIILQWKVFKKQHSLKKCKKKKEGICNYTDFFCFSGEKEALSTLVYDCLAVPKEHFSFRQGVWYLRPCPNHSLGPCHWSWRLVAVYHPSGTTAFLTDVFPCTITSIKTRRKGRGVEQLPSLHETLGSSPSTHTHTKKNRSKRPYATRKNRRHSFLCYVLLYICGYHIHDFCLQSMFVIFWDTYTSCNNCKNQAN